MADSRADGDRIDPFCDRKSVGQRCTVRSHQASNSLESSCDKPRYENKQPEETGGGSDLFTFK